jgi:hypothetical protein
LHDAVTFEDGEVRADAVVREAKRPSKLLDGAAATA